MRTNKHLIFITLSALLNISLTACGEDETPDETPDAMADESPDAMPAEAPYGSEEDVTRAEQLWTDMSGYETWQLMPDTVDFEPSQAPHGAFARIFVNDEVENLGDGAIVVKQNYQSMTEDDYAAVTVMKKITGYSPDAGDWFWVKYEANGTIAVNEDGIAMAGKIGLDGPGCIQCHNSAEGGDYLFKN